MVWQKFGKKPLRCKLGRWIHRATHGEGGQSLLIVAFAFVALLVIIGLAVDLGLVYVERIRLGKACDAAALAAAQELPFEEFAIKRAMQYLRENGYGPENTRLHVSGPPSGDGAAIESSWNQHNSDVIGDVYVDCQEFEDDTLSGSERDNSADKIRVSGRVHVSMNFMRLIGFDRAPVSASAIAENVSHLDVVIVYDKSGSMQFDTRCFDCYDKAEGEVYPEGVRYPLPFDDTFCNSTDTSLVYNSYEILVAEAEYYAYSTSYFEHDYHVEAYQFPNTYWAIQRTPYSAASGERDPVANDKRGAHMMHMPFSDIVDGHSSAPDNAPRLDYVFTIPTAATTTWYIWLRGQCGGGWWDPAVSSCVVHWGVDGSPQGRTAADAFGNIKSDDGSYAGSNGNRWIWERAGSVRLNPGQHEVNIWGGGPGFRLDKIVVTRNPEGPSGTKDRSPSFIKSTTPSWNQVRDQDYQTYAEGSYYGGPPDTGGRNATSVPGRPSFACHQCNPIYGLVLNQDSRCEVGTTVDPDTNCEPGYPCCSDLNGDGDIDYEEKCNNINDDLFDDKQPIRAAQEAAKNFAKRLQARSDQLGFVEYSNSAFIRRELNCIKTPARGLDRMPEGRGIWDPVDGPDNAWIWCYDHRTGPGGYTGDRELNDVTHGSIIGAIDSMEAEGNTNMADGIKKGISTLSTSTGHYGRPNAASIMILMTDGQANEYDKNDVCTRSEYKDMWHEGGTAKDCVVYYATIAKNSNIVIYTIGLGDSADHALLERVSEMTGGIYHFAPSAQDLDRIFQEIADQIFLRLIQ
jgi:hypothetical protein